jgi:hypothetical protein
MYTQLHNCHAAPCASDAWFPHMYVEEIYRLDLTFIHPRNFLRYMRSTSRLMWMYHLASPSTWSTLIVSIYSSRILAVYVLRSYCLGTLAEMRSLRCKAGCLVDCRPFVICKSMVDLSLTDLSSLHDTVELHVYRAIHVYPMCGSLIHFRRTRNGF